MTSATVALTYSKEVKAALLRGHAGDRAVAVALVVAVIVVWIWGV